MNKVKTKLMITRKYLDQLYEAVGKQLDIDVKQYNMANQAGSIRVDALGRISQAIKDIEVRLQLIEDCISLAEDMEKGLKDNEQTVKKTTK